MNTAMECNRFISYCKRRARNEIVINPLTPKLNPSAQRSLPRFFILIFKGIIARRLYKSFGVKGLNELCRECMNRVKRKRDKRRTFSYQINNLKKANKQID
jgi:hypothetical protein